MNLNTENWREFRIGTMFDIYPTKSYKNMTSDELSDGGTSPFVINSAENNGIGGFSTLPPTEKGDIITFSDTTDGNTFFYQPFDFIGFSHVQGMHPLNHKWTKSQYLFLISILMFHNKGLFNYGRKMRRDIIANTLIKLPVKQNDDGSTLIDDKYLFSKEGYVPDWEFMDRYIKSLNHKPLSTNNRGGFESHTLGVETWKDFYLGNLFSSVYKAKANVKGDLDYYISPFIDSIRFISRTELNNGCDCYVSSEGLCGIEEGNAITIGDTTATVFYQKDRFVCGDHMVICRADWINVYTAMFIVSLLKKEKYRYSYGRAYKMDLILNTKIKLPVTKKGYPDWTFIENYIKYLPYGDKL